MAEKKGRKVHMRRRALLLAIALHVALLLLLLFGLAVRKNTLADDSGSDSSVELWNSVEAPVQAIEPPPASEPPAKEEQEIDTQETEETDEADIALQTAPSVKPTPTQKPKSTPRPTLKPPQKVATPVPTSTTQPSKKPSPKAPSPVQEKEKDHSATHNKMLERLRRQAAQSVATGQGESAGQGTGSGKGSNSGSGSGKRAALSEDYLARIRARIIANTTFGEDVPGNPKAEIEFRLSPDGTLIGKPRLLRSSGHRTWDEAALRGVEATGIFPRNPATGVAPSQITILRGPKDQ